ncbi:MAG: His Kinase A (phospho-acceptor) domain/Histidine kinase-, DNA gyrase B-, and HSP90-like ATPase/CHASE [Marinobacter excellens HL-55]|uniref:histidine kinase n=1 Tax=Marinobacter excellens HL-55 TaxID=1305731 RepID=A0A0N8KK72_9GAMM|nr:MAG: His Kinase A (phospho-acceptor) domain/Histidine kinase-, DNA gyrase B-, and HSP90-like ATPase/CHASE [Marinobacter excellens HL-55]
MKPWQSWSLRRRSFISLILPLLVAAIVLVIMAKVLAFNRQAEDELQQGLKVLGQIHSAHAALAEAASGVRGYLLTKDETFLAPYQRAEDALKKSLRQLEVDVKDPAQRENLANITALVAVKLANLAQLKNPDMEIDNTLIRTYSLDNKDLLDRLRQSIEEMETRENQIIHALQNNLNQARENSQWAIFSTLLAAVALSVMLSQVFARDLINRIRCIRDNAIKIGSGIPPIKHQGGYQDELADLDQLVVHTGFMLDRRLQELEYAKTLAENAYQVKTDFLSRTSHELRTPLNAIIGFGDLLDNSRLTTNQQHHINVIRRSASHLLALVNDLLDLSRSENMDASTVVTPVSLKEAVTTAVDFVSQAAMRKHVQLHITTDYDSHVLANSKCLLQILINLLDNAVKFTPKNTTVSVGWRLFSGYNGKNVEIVVHDCGPGIAPGLEKELFYPFNRLDSNTEGLGLGLAISLSLASQMSGTIEHRPIKKGCEFVLTLPAANSALRGQYADAFHEPNEKSKLLKADKHPDTTWILAIENTKLLLIFETLAARFHARIIHASDRSWPNLLTPGFSLLVTDIEPARLDKPPGLIFRSQLFITSAPPQKADGEHIRWLPHPATPQQIRLLLKEIHQCRRY